MIAASLRSHHAQALIGPRLAPLMRAAQVFGFHLATVDLRQSSDKHEAVVAELLKPARIEPDYPALAEDAKRDLLLRLLNDARPLRVPDAHFELYLKDTTSLPQLGSSFNNQYTRMNDAWWTLVRINPDGSTQTVDADRSIEVANEQLIVDWGISVTIDQPEYTGQFSAYTKPLGAGVEYADAGAAGAGWYMGVPDVDGETAWNWIRSGLAGDTALDFPDYTGYDDDQTYE